MSLNPSRLIFMYLSQQNRHRNIQSQYISKKRYIWKKALLICTARELCRDIICHAPWPSFPRSEYKKGGIIHWIPFTCLRWDFRIKRIELNEGSRYAFILGTWIHYQIKLSFSRRFHQRYDGFFCNDVDRITFAEDIERNKSLTNDDYIKNWFMKC